MNSASNRLFESGIPSGAFRFIFDDDDDDDCIDDDVDGNGF